jgi:hypothetical protein
LARKLAMEKLARILDWIAIALFAIVNLLMMFPNPSAASALPLLNLLPFGLALIALRADSRRCGAWLALGVNISWAVVLVGVAASAVLGYTGSPLGVIAFCLVVAAPCALNVKVLIRRLRPRPSHVAG